MPTIHTETSLAIERATSATGLRLATEALLMARAPDTSLLDGVRSALDRFERAWDVEVWSNTPGFEEEYVIRHEKGD